MTETLETRQAHRKTTKFYPPLWVYLKNNEEGKLQDDILRAKLLLVLQLIFWEVSLKSIESYD